jgi:sarcosine oxidase subunit beta
LARLAGVELPVQPIRRQVVVTGPEHSWPRVFPMLLDNDTGLVMRRDGEAIALIYSNPDEPAGMNLQFDPAQIEIVAEKMLQRAPSLEAAGFNYSRCWAGCYEVSPDHHAIIGESGVPGFLLCNGFSGHGIMHAPAAGLALAEMIVFGQARSIDLAPLAYSRFAENRLLHEAAVF